MAERCKWFAVAHMRYGAMAIDGRETNAVRIDANHLAECVCMRCAAQRCQVSDIQSNETFSLRFCLSSLLRPCEPLMNKIVCQCWWPTAARVSERMLCWLLFAPCECVGFYCFSNQLNRVQLSVVKCLVEHDLSTDLAIGLKVNASAHIQCPLIVAH